MLILPLCWHPMARKCVQLLQGSFENCKLASLQLLQCSLPLSPILWVFSNLADSAKTYLFSLVPSYPLVPVNRVAVFRISHLLLQQLSLRCAVVHFLSESC